MCPCPSNPRYSNLYFQLDSTLHTVYSNAQDYLAKRENKDYAAMRNDHRAHRLETLNPNHQYITYSNQLHQKLHHFYMQAINTYHMAEMSDREANTERERLSQDNVDVDNIINMMQILKAEAVSVLNETETLLINLHLPKPNVAESDVTFNRQIVGHIRDFLIIKEFIEACQDTQSFLNYICEQEMRQQQQAE